MNGIPCDRKRGDSDEEWTGQTRDDDEAQGLAAVGGGRRRHSDLRHPANGVGGAGKFLKFLEEELDPYIRARYNTTDRPAGILGVDFYEDMGRNFNATVSALGRTANPGLTWKSRIYPGHTHTTILAPALNDALLYLYGPHLP
ncbi:MAG: hypothetical protein F4Y16_07735 [Holophagales bacterium]|nr:hypothetical protein [Holophagales bacterium]MYH26960.1 hypothetical protein [Holophagales bacterium]